MKFGLGSFDAYPPRQSSYHKFFAGTQRGASYADTYRDVMGVLVKARVICPYPPGSHFRDNALIVSPHDPVRWELLHHGSQWQLNIWVLDKVVGQGWIDRENTIEQQQSGRDLTQREVKEIIDDLTSDDTAWNYRFNADDRRVERLQQQIFPGQPLSRLRQAEHLASVIAALLYDPEHMNDNLIRYMDEVPTCPQVPKPKVPQGQLSKRYKATRRVWQTRGR
jgi:hypothetical protein